MGNKGGPPKIVNLGNKLPAYELRAALDQCLRNEKPMAEWYRYNARMMRAKYEALQEAGFSDSQALELCKDLGVS